MISGLVTATLLLAFVAMAVWAWSPRSRVRFAEAARLPLEDDVPPVGEAHDGGSAARAGDRP
ncbi:cbb3-type cytochrome oxidase subunit 3 [Solimonas terrae]|uniref:Cbb3-type cytochrome c oxidase subunit 3 n=1 Tax=Solimonas terrae TaxID=1396819 RepID=A0A6M2BLG8_9GAMM|nr:cbb3-type cytochrome c oxidase subunit 3 [Solimonas terrae]NGY03190.1 cbb3-type cytochrome c oxidase subunit 3 [Solimonas terrae]